MSRLWQQVFFVRKRCGSNRWLLGESAPAATDIFWAKAHCSKMVLSVCSNSMILVTKALSQEVMFLAFVPPQLFSFIGTLLRFIAQLLNFIDKLSCFITQLLNFIDIRLPKSKKRFTHKTVCESFYFIVSPSLHSNQLI
ncbi:hypothetical protein FJQ98_03655 [Lysinibacillus agricola]|uniref:Uncharacterized protein n=1 Tax=Lysinibacillus agricola TaxID=2590012 RepID=A0ABX7ATN5_9BACI|nr:MULTISPECIES: hypothetical protein [Lysinibacillus]QQP13179.1 hypothetical protein FJQ98_03655 [Lysinibacillus agricola]